DKNHVNIGTVIELLAAEFAQANDAGGSGVPFAGSVLMKRVAIPNGELLPADLPYSPETDVCNIGDFLDNLGQAPETTEISSSEPQHLALFEFANPRQDGLEVPRGEHAFQPPVYFLFQPLFAPWKL